MPIKILLKSIFWTMTFLAVYDYITVIIGNRLTSADRGEKEVGAFGFIFAVFSPVALFALSIVVVRLASGEWVNLALLGQINYMPYLGIVALALWHGMFDFFSAAKVSDGIIAAIMSTVFMIWAVVVVIVYKPAHLAREPKQVL